MRTRVVKCRESTFLRGILEQTHFLFVVSSSYLDMKNHFILSSTYLFDIGDKFFVSLCLFVLLFLPFCCLLCLGVTDWITLAVCVCVCVCERERERESEREREVDVPSQQQWTLDHM